MRRSWAVSATATSQAALAADDADQSLGPRPLPPGPRLPRLVQTAGFMFGGARFLEWARRRYGGAVYMRTLFDDGFVMLFEPGLVREVFQGPHEQLNAGEANALLGPILGERSVLLLDGAEHLRHRRLMLPPFHGRRMQAYAETMRDAADAEIDSWPVGREFALLPSLQSLTLRVIMRAVFGFEPGPAEDELQRRLREMIRPVAQPRGLVLMFTLGRLGRRTDTVQRFEAAKRAVDEILYAEIARRRQADDLAERDDVFSSLLLAEDEHGERLTDREVRDELVTLLIAGHETTATGLGWTFDLLLHTPAVLDRCDPADTAYLDAVVKESLRLRPVIPGRRARRPRRAVPRRRLRGAGGDGDQPVDPDHPPPRRSLPGAGDVPARAVPRRGHAGHVHVGAVRRWDASLPRRELCAHGDARRARAGARADAAPRRLDAARRGAVPRDHARAQGGGPRDPGARARPGDVGEPAGAERRRALGCSRLHPLGSWAGPRAGGKLRSIQVTGSLGEHMRRFRILTALTTASLALAAAPAAFAQTSSVGNSGGSATMNVCVASIECTYVNYHNGKPTDVVKHAGWVTNWSVNAGSIGGQVQLRILRPASGGKLKVVQTSSTHTVNDIGLNTFSAHIKVKAGDVLALRNATSGIYMAQASPGTCVRYFSPDPSDGQSAKPNTIVQQLHLLLSAHVKS